MTKRKFKHQHAEPTRVVTPTTDHNGNDSWDSIHSPSGYAIRAKRLRLKTAATLLAMSAAALLAGCGIAALAGAAGAVPATKTESQGIPKYDVDPQVIYRIDDHRYVTMENYPDCKFENYVSGTQEVYYHDDKLGITKKLGPSIAPYQGKLIIAAPEGKNLAFPGVPWGVCTYNDKGCSVYIGYSTDSGRTWNGIKYMQYATDPARTNSFTVVVTDDAIYVEDSVYKSSLFTRYPIGHGIDYANPPLPSGYEITRAVPAPKAKTPSGMDHLVCDASITPRSVTYIQPASAH